MSAPGSPVPTPNMSTVGVYWHGRTAVILYAFGRRWMHAIEQGAPTRCIQIERDKQLRPVLHEGLPYPVARAAATMLCSVHTINERAREVLECLAKNEVVKEPEFV